MNNNISNLWNSLHKRGYELPELDVFANDMQKEENLRKVYATLIREGFYTPEYDTFVSDMAYKPEPAQTVQPVQQVQQPVQTMQTEQPQQSWNNPTYNPESIGGTEVAQHENPQQVVDAPEMLRKPTADTQVNQAPWLEKFNQSMNEISDRLKFNPVEMESTLDGEGNTIMKPKMITSVDDKGNTVTGYRSLLDGSFINRTDELDNLSYTVANTIDVEKANREQVGELSPKIDTMLEEAKKRDAEAPNEAVQTLVDDDKNIFQKFAAAMSMGNGGNAMDNSKQMAANQLATASSKEVQELSAAQRSMRDAQRIIAEADHNAQEGTFGKWLESSFAGGAKRGFGQKLFDAGTWDMGASDGSDAILLLSALQKADKGDKLTESEQAMLDAYSVKMATEAYFGSYVGHGYKAGGVTAEALPFMLEMCLNPASGAGEGTQAMLTRYALKRFGKQAVKNNSKKYIASKLTARVAGDLAGASAMTATTGIGRVTEDTANRMAGDVTFDTDKDTGYSYFSGHENGDDGVTAFAKAFGSTTIENYSEMVGEYFSPVFSYVSKPLTKYASKTMEKIGLKSVNEFIEDVATSDVAKLVGDFEKHAKWNGVFSEYAEEVTGNMMNAVTVGDMTLDTKEGTGVFNLDQNIDTFLGVSLMGGFMSAVKTSGYRTPKYRAKKAMTASDDAAASLFNDADTWGSIRNSIAFGSDEDAQQTLVDVLASDVYTPEQKQAVMQYAKNAETYKGMLKGEQKRRSEDNGSNQVDVETSYDNGYTLDTPQDKNDAKNMYDYQRQQFESEFGSFMLQQIDDNPLKVLASIAGSTNDITEGYTWKNGENSWQVVKDDGDWVSVVHNGRGVVYRMEKKNVPLPDYTQEQKQKALDYVNAKATYDGMLDNVRDNLDAQLTAGNAKIDSHTNNQSGMIHRGTMKMGNRQVYVVDGNLVMTDDGSGIDVNNSSESLLVRDAQTGNLEWASPHDFTTVDAPIAPQAERESMRNTLLDEYAQKAADEIDGKISLEPNSNFKIVDKDGAEHDVVVFYQNEDGSVTVAIDGIQQDDAFTPDQLQEMHDNYNLKRLSDYEAEKAQKRAQQAQAEKEANRPQYNTGDVVTLNMPDGTQVTGQISASENEDGQIEVYTDKPVNGSKFNLYNRDELDGMLVSQQKMQQPDTSEDAGTQQKAKARPYNQARADYLAETYEGYVPEYEGAPEDYNNGYEGYVPVEGQPNTAGEYEGYVPEYENAPVVGQQENNAELLNAQADAAEEGYDDESIEPMPMTGSGEDAEPDFTKATPKRAHDYIFNETGLENEDAKAFMDNNVTASQKELDRLKAKKPKMGTSLSKFNKDMALWNQKVAEAQQKADYWKQVKAEHDAVLTKQNEQRAEEERLAVEKAKAEEEAYRQEQARLQAEREQNGTNNVSPAIRDKWNNATKIDGAEDEIVLPNGEKVKGHYVLAESGTATPSHDINNGFAETEGFPVDENGNNVNTRDYKGDTDAQNVTRTMAGNYDSRAVQSPVVVSEDAGVVLSGNGRTMAGELAATNGTDGAYNQYVADHAGKYGFTTEQVQGMSHPRVYFVPDGAMPYTAETFDKFNQQETKSQNKTEQAVKLGKTVSDEAFGRIINIINRFDTLAEFYADSKATAEAIGELQKDGIINQAQFAELFDGDGISAIGKELLENTLIGKAFESNPNAVREISEFRSMRQSIITALAEISNNIALGKDYSLESELAQAIDLVYQARKNGSKAGEKVSWYARQQNLDFFGLNETVADYTNATVMMMADAINDNRTTQLKKVMHSYNVNAQQSANGQTDIFAGGVKTKDDIINDVNSILGNGKEKETKPAEAERKEDSVQEDGTDGTGNEGEQVDTENAELSHDMLYEFMRQFLFESDGDMRLLDLISDDDIKMLLDVYESWEKVNDNLGAVHTANDRFVNDKNASIANKAKEAIKAAEYASEKAFMPVQDVYHDLLEKYGIEDDMELVDAIAQAEAEVDKKPTDAQKEVTDKDIADAKSDVDEKRKAHDDYVKKYMSKKDHTDKERKEYQKEREKLENSILSAQRKYEKLKKQQSDANLPDGVELQADGNYTVDGVKNAIVYHTHTWKGSIPKSYGSWYQIPSINADWNNGIKDTEGTLKDAVDAFRANQQKSETPKFEDEQNTAEEVLASLQEKYADTLVVDVPDGTAVDENGYVLNTKNDTILWHGTESDVKSVKDLRSGEKRADSDKASFNGEGISFAGDKSVALDYANGNEDKVLSGRVKLQKPYYVHGRTFNSDEEGQKDAELFSKALKELGYDGIIVLDTPTKSQVTEVIVFDADNIEELDSRYHEGWDGKYSQWKLRHDYYDEIERKEKQAVAEGRKDYYIAERDGWGQRNGSFIKIWLLPEEVEKNQHGDPSYKGLNLWTRESAWHSEEGFQLGRIYFSADEFNEAYGIKPKKNEDETKEEPNTAEETPETPVKEEQNTAEEPVMKATGEDGYSISNAEYTTKRGKKLQMKLVKFGGELSKEQMNAAKALARDLKGWYDKEKGGFMMRDEESAQKLADTVLGNETKVLDEQPVSLDDMQIFTEQSTTEQENTDTETKDKTPDEGEKAMELFNSVNEGDVFTNENGLTVEVTKKVSGKRTPAVKIRWTQNSENGRTAQDVKILDALHLYQYIQSNNLKKVEPTQTPVEKEEQKPNTTPETGNAAVETSAPARLVSDDRMAKLKERMRKKLRGQANLGVDPELLAIGAELAVGHIERGLTKFADYAKQMIDDIGDMVRPYLKSFYNAVRDMPEAEEYAEQMDSYDDVRKFDVANFDKQSTNAMEAAEMVNNEQIAEKDTETVTKQVKTERNEARKVVEEGGEPEFRPATAEDLDKSDVVVYYDGKPTNIMMIIHKGEQVGAGTFSQPEIDSVYLTNGKNVKLSELSVRVEKPAKKSKKTSQSKEKAVTSQGELNLFGDFFDNTNVNTDNNEETNVQPGTTEKGRAGHNTEQNAQVGGSTGNEAEGTDGRRVDRRDERNPVSDKDGSRGLPDTPQSSGSIEETQPNTAVESEDVPTVKKNVGNNHAERGKDYAPKSVDARIEANIKAIELMQKLILEDKKATPAQMKVLRQYSGWGGLGKAFGTEYSNPIARRLKELLGDEAYEQANMSRNSAYYTPASVIDAMWDIAKALGFKGGNVLEGSAGIGNIIGSMPTSMSERSDIQAVEIDETTGNILKLLYPEAKVMIQGFEKTKVQNGSVDLAITNVPFVTGLRVMDESGDKDLSKKFHDIHDFCIAKNIRKLREGGIGIFITSSGTLDNSQKLRDWIINEGGADVIGAYRLNNETFGGTGATSDIIVVRKRVNGVKSKNAIDVNMTTAERTATYTDEAGNKAVLSMDYNQYFVEHPENMGGKMMFGFEKKDTFRPTSKALYPVRGEKQADSLAKWVESFKTMEKETAMPWASATKTEKVDDYATYESLGAGIKEGSMLVNSDGVLCIAQSGMAKPLGLNANKVKGHTKAECFNAYKSIKEAVAAVLDYQTQNEGDEGLKPLLTKLNKAYDDFVKTYGHLHKNTSISFLKNDVDWSNIMALESFKEIGDKKGNRVQTFGKTDIFKGRVVQMEKEPKPENVKDGIIASVYQFGRINPDYIASVLGRSVEDVKNEIIESGLGFENPITAQMEVSYQYLSGNVREKLAQAEEANQQEGANGKYDKNIEALKKIIPMDIPAHLIEFSIGSSWIDPKLYEEYIKEQTDLDVTLTNIGGTWEMKAPHWVNHEKNRTTGIYSQMFRKQIFGHELIKAALTNKTITVSRVEKNFDGTKETVTDKEATSACAAKVDEIRADFKEWARQKMQADAELSAKMQKDYNDRFNNYVPMEVSDEFIPEYFGGANHKYKMRPHQAKAIIRGTMQPVMLAHEVGTGKTFTLISTAMEMRRLGTAKKPMIVVQNATVGQFVASAKDLYPNAKILTLDDKDHTLEGRKNFYAKIKYNDWDMIVVPQSVFERIPDSEERQIKFIQDKIQEKMDILEQLREAKSDSMAIRQAESEISKLNEELNDIGKQASDKRKKRDEKKEAVTRQNTEVKAKEMLDRATDDVENFDDMGIDAILVDEAHEYKHLGFATAMQRGVKGVDPSYSKKSQGVYLKAQAVLEKNNGRNVVFATGTPISNTAAEIWTFMKYLMPADLMKEYNIYYFDDFVRNFGNLTQMMEFSTSGKFKENNRFSGYVNLPELIRIWSGVADTVRTDDAQAVKDNVPEIEGGKATDVYLPQTKALRSIMKFVKEKLEEYENMTGAEKKENSHIPLVMYGIAKAAAVDARLVMEDAEDEPNSKTNEAVRQTLRSLEDSKKYKGTVALFADNYQNKRSGFNLYEDIRLKLIQQGVPADQIAIIKGGMTDKKKQEIFDKVNAGEIRVIMGSTFTLGTGVNIQERLHTLIHIDAPNRPMDYTQRNGRIVRQGNLHKEWGIPVRVLRFGVEDSLDVTAYQRLKTKGAIADSIMNGKAMIQNSMEDRTMEEEEDVFGDITAQLSGSQYAMLKNQAEREVRKYESKKKQHEADQAYVYWQIPNYESYIKEEQSTIEENQAMLDKLNELFGSSLTPAITVNGKTYANVEEMADFFKVQNKKIKEVEDELKSIDTDEQRTRSIDIQIGNAVFTFKTIQAKEIEYQGLAIFKKVTRRVVVSCPELNLSDIPVTGGYIKGGIENILKEIVSGEAFERRLALAKNRKERYESELELLKQRQGKPFQYEEELKQAREKLEEYTDLMIKELAEKEAKYAEMDKDVEAATGVGNAEEATEEDVEKQVGEDEPYTDVVTPESELANEAITLALNENAGIRVIDEEDVPNTAQSGEYMAANEKFNEELQKQIDGTLPEGHVYQLGFPSGILLSTGIPNLPIQMNAARLLQKSTQQGHTYNLEEVKNLVEAIQSPIAIFEYGNKDKAQNLIIEIEKDGKNFLVGISITPTVNGRRIDINSVRNVFPKDNAEWLRWIETGKMLYGNKEKIKAVIDKQRIDLADVEYLNLNSVAKILNEFENPPIPSVNNSENAEFMTVWHGSAAIFDAFDSKYFLSGEGSMAYGDGHYVSNVRGTGEMYAGIAQSANAEGLSDHVYLNGEELDPDDNQYLYDLLVDYEGNDKKALDEVNKTIEKINSGERFGNAIKREAPLAKKMLEENEGKFTYEQKAEFAPARQLYRVEVPDDITEEYERQELEFTERIRPILRKLIREEHIHNDDILFSKGLAIMRQRYGDEYTSKFEYVSDRWQLKDKSGANYILWTDMFNKKTAQEIADKMDAEGLMLDIVDGSKVKAGEYLMEHLSGRGLFYELEGMTGSSRGVSKLLSHLGYVGFKVPTGMQRGGDGRGMNYVIFKDSDLKIQERIEFMEKLNGTVYGWAEGNTIHLTKAGNNPNSKIHEYTHLWAKAVRIKNPELWKRVVELMKQTPVWNEVVDDPAYNLTSDDAIASEALSRLSGRKNAKKMTEMAKQMIDEADGVFEKAKATDLISRVKQVISDFWKWVGQNLFDMKDFKNVDEVTDRVLFDLLNKTELGLDVESQGGAEFQVVTDKQTNEWFDKQPKVVTFKTVATTKDGGMSAPMASKVKSSVADKTVTGKNGKSRKVKETKETGKYEFGKLLVAEENPSLIKRTKSEARTDDNGKNYEHEYGEIEIVREDGKSLVVAYDPYDHSSDSMINDQFKSAWERDNLIVIRQEIAQTDLDEKYQADNAYLPTGKHDWKTGVLGRAMENEDARHVYLARYSRPLEKVSWDEVTQEWIDKCKKYNLDVPFNIVPKAIREKLADAGINIVAPENGMGQNCFDAYEEWKQERLRYRETEGFEDGTVLPIEWYREDLNGRMYRVEGLAGTFADKEQLLDAFRNKYDNYVAVLTNDGDGIEVNRWSSLRKSTKPVDGVSTEQHIERKTRNAIYAVNEQAQKLGLDVDVRTSTEGLKGRQAKAKGWFDPKTGKIVIVLPNHSSQQDVMRTLLHEGVAHYGLRKLFGEDFDTFLDNVFDNATVDIRRQIADLAAKHNWSFRVATEEYLASLAEDTRFENAMNQSWWAKIKDFFLRMLRQKGVFLDKMLTDNELRYVLWRSYDNLVNTNHGIMRQAENTVMEQRLGVGNYSQPNTAVGVVASNPFETRRKAKELANIFRTLALDELPFSVQEYIENNQALNDAVFAADDVDGAYEYLKGLSENEYKSVTKGRWYYPITSYNDIQNKPKEDVIDDVEEFMEHVRSNAIEQLVTDQKWLVENMPELVESIKFNDDATSQEEFRRNTELDENAGVMTGNVDIDEDKLESLTNGRSNAVSENSPVGDDGYLYRDGDAMEDVDRAIVADKYEREVRSGMYQFREAVQDSMLSLRRFMEMVEKATGKKVKDYENAYYAENALSSRNHAEQDLYGKMLFNPLLDEIHRLAKENSSREEVTRYMMAKHGLERNEVMARRQAEKDAEKELGKDLREAEKAYQADPTDQDLADAYDALKQAMQDRKDALYQTYREKDFGGITGLMEEDDLVTAEGLAIDFVNDFENKHFVDNLWAQTNACTKATLEKTYKGGLLSKATYDDINSMYKYYIPLRGYDETTSDEVYSYLTHEKTGFSNVMQKAKGRSSVADDPIATIANMADNAIVQANRNLMKQKFLKFVMDNPTDLVSVSKMWLRYDDVADQWEVVSAQIDENDTPEQILAKTEAFEAQMQALAEAAPDKYKRGKDAANLPYKPVGRALNEHQVHVKFMGEDYILTINGSPRVAQALNGLTNPDTDVAGAVGAILKAGEWVNRQMSAFYTTRNPEFVLSNFLRDLLYANTTMWVKESGKYAWKFNKNFVKVNPAKLYSLIKKHNAGTLDMNDEVEKAFYQFMMNGGETGYTVVKDIEKQKKLIKKYVRMKDSSIPVELAWDLLGQKLDDINRSVENCARFAAFLTSRQEGRSIERSVHDAKEVSVNFNKKGSGSTFMGKRDQTKWGNVGAFTSGLGRSFYVFWNASIQGVTNFASLHKHHTGKALAMDAGLFLLGAVLAGIGGGDDDEYYNLPEHVRRSNICFKIPGTNVFCSIPIGIEQRAIYGMGELFSSLVSGRERMSAKETAKAIAGALSSLMPVDLMEGSGDVSISALTPSYVKPFVETMTNKDWKGMPIYKKTAFNTDDPEWTKASTKTNKLLTAFSEWTNEITGGDEFKKGVLNWNPSVVEHWFEGTFGGAATTVNKLAKAAETAFGAQEFDWRNVLIASRLVKSGSADAEERRINREYWKYQNEYNDTKRIVDKYLGKVADGDEKYKAKLEKMYDTKEYGRYQIVDSYSKLIKKYNDELKEANTTEAGDKLAQQVDLLKRQMISDVRAYDDNPNSIDTVESSYVKYGNITKPVGIQLEAIRSDKYADMSKYAEEYSKIASTPEYQQYTTYNKYKGYIDKYTQMAAYAKDDRQKENYLGSAKQLKMQLVEMLDRMNGKK